MTAPLTHRPFEALAETLGAIPAQLAEGEPQEILTPPVVALPDEPNAPSKGTP